ncbi:excinuclease ABC subunit UvrA [bacterium]
MDKIIVSGAREHNLKNINVEIPRNKLVVITGLSGSGKSSLAFDTIYAEGQRRYVESLSSYARQFLGQMQKPDVDSITGLSPAIAIEQKGPGYNPRSTVGTMTEIYDYLRVLFARIGTAYCYKCGRLVTSLSVQEMVDQIMDWENNLKIVILAPLIKGRKGEYKDLFKRIQKDGFTRVRIDDRVYNLEEDIKLDKKKKHTIQVIVDRVTINTDNRSRISDSIEIALKYSSGELVVLKQDKEILFSRSFSCPECGISFSELSPRMFSFNNPYGACEECSGLGTKMDFNPDLIIPDKTKSISEGALNVPGFSEFSWSVEMLGSVAERYGFSIDIPVNKMRKKDLDIILYGTGDRLIHFKYHDPVNKKRYEYEKAFEGIIPILMRRYMNTSSDTMRQWYEKLMSAYDCPKCNGARLRPESMAVTIGGKNIIGVSDLSIKYIIKFFKELRLDEKREYIAKQLLKEIYERLNFLNNVGLNYLSLMRKAGTLSGGEAQRINLATQIGSGLTGVLYVLDEPSIGLHQRDNRKLLNTLKKLRDLGNTLIVVEHDEETMNEADHIIDLGPLAGESGGRIVAQGSIDTIKKNKKSLTGAYMRRELIIPVPKKRKAPKDFLTIIGAQENNLKKIDVKIPLGVLNAVSGVSGSGKSTLVEDILYKTLAQKIYRAKAKPGLCKEIKNIKKIDKVINIDQSPIGRTPRSNPATYTGVFGPVRELFAGLPESKARGYKPGRFSFNVPGGRCEACSGDGVVKIEMHFLPDVYVQCDVCKGKRFDRETLEIRYKGKNISDVLEMTVDTAYDFFIKIPRIKRILELLKDVGLGYVKLGQPATTLSGGEAQRIKLSSELSKRAAGKTLYILDEPTTGLHFSDVHKLIEVLQRLVDMGNTVVVIEHNLDVLKTCDYIIDLGPEGGDAGGEITACGTPEQIIQNKESYTGRYLKSFIIKKQ